MIVLADSDPRFQTRVAEHIGRRSELLVVDGGPELEKVLQDKAGRIDVVLLGPNFGLEDAFRIARQIQATTQDISVLLIASAVTAEVLQQALRSGIRDVLPATFTGAQLLEAIGRAEALTTQIRGAAETIRSKPPEKSDSKVITVFSSKGGCGKSFVASNLAVALAQKTGEKVAMIDLDLQFGDLAIMLQLFPARTIFDAAQNLDRLDEEALQGYMTPHRSNVMLLAAPLEPGIEETISADAVTRIVGLARNVFRYVVIDCPPSFTDHVLAALDVSDECILMTSMDVPSIKNMKLSLQTLQLLGFGRDRIRLVLNRADSRVGLTVQAVEKTLGTNVDVSVPSSRDVSVSINRGSPLIIDNPKSPVVASILRMMEFAGVKSGVAADGEPQRVTEAAKGGLFKRRAKPGRSEA
ncbi:MAG TPA: AAA family ATPase [Actinomycetota bacterium]